MTQQRCLLINGWAMPELALMPLKQDLGQLGFEVVVLPCCHNQDLSIWQQYVQHALDADVLMGWSMGGQLATLLVDACYAQTGQAKALITLASNPQFVQSDDWSQAMTFVQFLDFQRRFSTRPEQTLKRFKHLIMQGELGQLSDDWAQFSSCFSTAILSLDLHQLAWQLDLLGQLQTQSILKDYAGKQLHIFADDDVIVPRTVAQQVQALVDNSAHLRIEHIADASHAFVYSQSREISQKIRAFLSDEDDTPSAKIASNANQISI